MIPAASHRWAVSSTPYSRYWAGLRPCPAEDSLGNPRTPGPLHSAAVSSDRRPASTRRGRAPLERGWADAGVGHADPQSDRPALLDRDPAAERDGRAAHGARAQQHDPGPARPRRAGWRATSAQWICGTDHAGIATQAVVEKALAAEGIDRRELGPRRVRPQGVGVEGGVRRPDHRPVQAPRLHPRLPARAVHDGRRLREGGPPGLRGPLRQGLHLPRPLHGQLGPRAAARRSPTSRWRSARSPTRSSPSPTRSPTGPGRSSSRRCARDDARRHRRRRPPRGRALPRPRRADGRSLPLVGRELPIVADEHVQPEFGTGALKVTPGARPQRLRDRPQRHGLPAIVVIGEDGRMTADARRALTPA